MERESKRAQNTHQKQQNTPLFLLFFTGSVFKKRMRVLVNCVCCYKKNIMLWRAAAAAAAARAVTRIHQVTIDGQGQAV